MIELVRTKKGTHGESGASNRVPAGGGGFVLVVEDVAKRRRRVHLHFGVEGVTVRELSFVEAVLSKKRDAGSSTEESS